MQLRNGLSPVGSWVLFADETGTYCNPFFSNRSKGTTFIGIKTKMRLF